MSHEFIILNKGVLETYTEFDDIPESFDNVIKFLPEIPPEPHSEEQHKEISQWHDRLKDILQRETNARSN